MRFAAVSLLLLGLAFVQDPGFLVPDTKFDLVQAPGRFLARATHLWDGLGFFGQLQNQAYGYLWPMGSFFLAGSVLDLPGWVVQRAWMGVVVVVAFLGCALLMRTLRVRSDLACVLAGLAYALSPRMLTTLGPISVEAWPSALAPWVLLPLVRGATAGSPRRAAALSALAVAMVGGVNAAATFAVIPLGAVWLLTRTPGPRRRAMMLWWPAFVLLGCLWWLVPLFVMGAYSPPFLDFIEASSITTFPTTLFDTLRGTSDWVPYVDASWRAGNDLITRFYLPLNSGIVLLLGFAGLMHQRLPHRQFWVLSLLTGVVMVTLGHTGSVHGWFAGDLRGLLDGPLAPVRNVHKFDPVIRLPLVAGLAWVVDGVAARVGERVRAADGPAAWEAVLQRVDRTVFLGLSTMVVLAAALPAFTGRLTPSGALVAVPGYWRQTAAWLSDRTGDGTALLLPGSGFADYVWGAPQDEPLQYLGQSRWAVRNAIPLTPPGTIRMLDGIEDRVAQGRGSQGLTDTFRRAGVRYLVVRNDLARDGDNPDPVLVHQALTGSPGVRRVATFGPQVGGAGHVAAGGQRVLVNGGWQAPYPAVEVFEVSGSGRAAVSASGSPTVVGGPEDLADLSDLSVLATEPTRLAVDVGARHHPDGPVVLTDGLRVQERFFGRVHDAVSATVTPGDVRRSGNPTRDYQLGTGDRWATTVRLTGVRRVSASSSGSDANNPGGVRPGQLPYAALDGSVQSAWTSGTGAAGRAHWRVDLDGRPEVRSVTLVGGREAQDGQRVRVRTESGTSRGVDLGPGREVAVALPAGRTGWLRVEDASGGGRSSLALAEVRVPGVTARRSLVLPRVPAAWGAPDAIVLRALTDHRTGCVQVGVDVRCVPGRERSGEESAEVRRVVDLPAAASYAAQLTVRPRPSAALERLLQRSQPLGVSGSSTGVPDLRGSALAAVDGDPGTTWTADTADLRPSLQLNWIGRRSVRAISVSVDPDADARRPERVRLQWPGGRRTVTLDARGSARFPAVRTDRLTVRVDRAEDVADVGFDRSRSPVPVGISELRLGGVPFLPRALPTQTTRYPCGSGPTVTVDGREHASAVVAAPADLLRMQTATAELCGTPTADLPRGGSTIDVRASASFLPDSLVLSRTGGVLAGPAHERSVTSTGQSARAATVPPGDTLLAFRENANPGWRGSTSGGAVPGAVVDGWQQGYDVGGGAGTVRETFAPDAGYRWGLGLGLAALAGLVLGVLVPRRRRRRPAVLPLPLQDRVVPDAVLGAAGLATVGLLAGSAGVVAALVVTGVALLARARAGDALAWLLAATCLVVAAAYAVQPWGDSSGWAGSHAWPSYVMLVPLVGAVALAGSGRVPRPRPFRRRAGTSR